MLNLTKVHKVEHTLIDFIYLLITYEHSPFTLIENEEARVTLEHVKWRDRDRGGAFRWCQLISECSKNLRKSFLLLFGSFPVLLGSSFGLFLNDNSH